tara:strand:- start:40 stop:345 length:306 start_codon:yes stop_codon:yes gene_type:complete
MNKIINILTVTIFVFILSACQTVSKKIDSQTEKEQKELSQWLNQSETDLKIVFGQPDKIEFKENRNRYYIYKSEKLKIKCERKFEINQNNMIIGFSSKNCF